MSTVSAASSHQHVKAQTAVQHQAKQTKVDADGDHDGTKQAPSAKASSKPLSATIGQNVSTTA